MTDPKYAVELDPQAREWAENNLRLAYASDCEKCYRAAGGEGTPRVFRCNLCGDERCPHGKDHDNECPAAGDVQLVGALNDPRKEA